MRNKILITGSSGYIGSHLMKSFDTGNFISCDLRDGVDFETVSGQQFDAVIHLAAEASVTRSIVYPEQCFDTNVMKLIPFLRNNKIDKFVFASTGGAIYGNRNDAKEEDASWNAILSPYGQSKFLAERVIERMHSNYAILRLGNVYGGDASLRGDLTVHARFKIDNPIVIRGTNQTRDFIHIEHVCKALVKAVYDDNITGIFNIGSGDPTLISDVANWFSLTRKVPIKYEPSFPGEVNRIFLNVSKAQKAGLL